MSKIYAVTLLTWTGLYQTRIGAVDRLAAMIAAKHLYRPRLALWAKETPRSAGHKNMLAAFKANDEFHKASCRNTSAPKSLCSKNLCASENRLNRRTWPGAK